MRWCYSSHRARTRTSFAVVPGSSNSVAPFRARPASHPWVFSGDAWGVYGSSSAVHRFLCRMVTKWSGAPSKGLPHV